MDIGKLDLTEYENFNVVLSEDGKMMLVQIGNSFFRLVPHMLAISKEETSTIIASDLYSVKLLK